MRTKDPSTHVRELDVTADGGRLHAYDRLPPSGEVRLTVVWHHGTPNIGPPPVPLFDASDRLGIRWVGYDRPGYGGSPRRPGRDIASAAGDVAAVVDALGIGRLAVMGHSGGGSHALACAALLPDRVLAAVSGSGLAPYGSHGLDWFARMAPAGVASLRAALAGREVKERYEAAPAEGDPGFTDADYAALSGEWAWLRSVVNPAIAGRPAGLVDDDLAYVAPWGFDPADIHVPTLLFHGADDRVVPVAHGSWLASTIPDVELWNSAGDGHVSVLRLAEAALTWLIERALDEGR